MSFELLFLSTKFFVILVLVSVLSFLLGWLMHGRKSALKTTPVNLTEVDPREQQVAQLQQQQHELEQQCQQALELRDAAESDAANQRRQWREAEMRLSAQQTELATALQQIRRLEKLQHEQSDQHDEQQEALRQQLNEFTTRVQTAESIAATARADHAELESTLAELKSQTQQQQSLAQAAQQQAQQAQQAKAKAEQQQHQLSAALQEAQQQAQHWQAEHAASMQNQQDLKNQLQAMQEAAQSRAAAVTAKASPFKKFTLVCQEGKSPPQAAKAALLQAQQQTQALELEYQQRLDAVNVLDAQTPLPKTGLATARTLLRETQKKLADARTLEERCTRVCATLERTFAQLPDAKSDDLTKIKGVKAVLSSKLNEYGIYTYQQIIELSAEDRLAYGDLLGFGNRIDREDWAGQAKRLATTG
jgi:predicted flap endonuclease-1-like 5' DNA nuclease